MPTLTRDECARIVTEHRPALLRLARRYCPSDAEDAVQIAALRLMKADLRTPEQVRSWLFTTTRRIALDFCREDARQRALATRYAARTDIAEADPEEAVCDRVEAEWLATELVERLPKRYRIVAEVMQQGGKVADIAERLGCSLKSAEHLRARTARRLVLALLAARVVAVLAALRRGARRPAPAALALAPAALLTLAVTVPAILNAAGVTRRPAGSRPVEGVESQPHLAAQTPVARPIVPTASPATPDTTNRVENNDDEKRVWQSVSRLPLPPAVPTPRSGDYGPQDDEITLLEEVLWCVQHPEVSPTNVGCQPHPTPRQSSRR